MNKEEYLQLLDDDGKLKQKFSNKKFNAKKEGLKCLLSFEEFCELLIQANLVSSDIGFTSPRKIVLARYNDEGDYVLGNCRFITHHENMLEQKQSEKTLEANRKKAKFLQQYNAEHYEEYHRKHVEGIHKSEHYKRRHAIAEEKRLIREASLDSRYCGVHNSMHGKHWATNGLDNILVMGIKEQLPEGYRLGRIMGLPTNKELSCKPNPSEEKRYVPDDGAKQILPKNSVSVMQFTKDMQYITTHASASKAVLSLNNPSALNAQSHITDVCKGRRKTAYGYIWKYADK